MAKLIDYTTSARPTPRVGGGIVPGPPVQRSNAVGEGLQRLGADIVQGTAEIMRFQKIEEERVNTLRAEEAFNKLRERQLDLSIGETNGYVRHKGADAVTRPLLPEYTKRFEDAEREIGAGLTNDVQRRKFKSAADVARLQFQEGLLRHLGREGDAYATQVYDGVVATEQQSATARWNSPNEVAMSLERIRNATEERAERLGWDTEYKGLVLRQELSKVHAAVVQQAVVNGNYRYAEQWYQTYRDDIDVNTAKGLAVAVENGTQKELTNRYNAEYLAGDDSLPALESLRKKVLADTTLAEDRRNILVGRIQGRQSVLEHRATMERDRTLRRLERGINELNSNTLAGFEPTADQFQPLLDATKDTELEPQAQAAVRLADATRGFRNSLPLQQERMLTEAEARIREDPTKFDRNVLSAWRQIYENQRRQVQDAPVSFLVRQGIVDAPQPIDLRADQNGMLANPEQAAGALQEHFAIARAATVRYAAPFKPLTPEAITVMHSALERASPEQKRNYFGSLSRASGKDLSGYMAMMAQLAPDDPVTAIAGSRAGRGDAAAADLMLRGQAILRPAPKSDGKPDTGGLLPMPPETKLRSNFDNIVRDAMAGKAEQRNAHYQAAKAVYAALSIDAGDRDTQIFQDDRWEKAITLAIGPIEKYNGRRIVMPSGYDYSRFGDEMDERVRDLLNRSLVERTRLSVAQESKQPLEKLKLEGKLNFDGYLLDPSWTADRLLDLPLENVGDGRYVFRVGDSKVKDMLGRDVEIDFTAPIRQRHPAMSQAIMEWSSNALSPNMMGRPDVP